MCIAHGLNRGNRVNDDLPPRNGPLEFIPPKLHAIGHHASCRPVPVCTVGYNYDVGLAPALKGSTVSHIPMNARVLTVFILFLTVSSSAAIDSHAATLTVTKIEDTNDGICDADCSLREAVVAARLVVERVLRGGVDVAARAQHADVLRRVVGRAADLIKRAVVRAVQRPGGAVGGHAGRTARA